jgi:hypothetical protein
MERLPIELLLEIGSYFKCEDFENYETVFPVLKGKCRSALYAIKQNLTLDQKKYVFYQSTKSSHFNCFKYLIDNGWVYDYATGAAAENGKLKCLKYAVKKGCSFHERTTAIAARWGHLDCLKYVHKKGCKFHSFTAPAAAGGGHLDCLKYTHKYANVWDEMTPQAAAQYGNLDCLKHCHEIGYNYSLIYLAAATIKKHNDCMKYMSNIWTEKNTYLKRNKWWYKKSKMIIRER